VDNFWKNTYLKNTLHGSDGSALSGG